MSPCLGRKGVVQMRHARGRDGHAVVIGGSMTGLTIAKALTERFALVTVVEHDPLPDSSSHRRGVPQGHHAHVLLPAGADALEELFPGLLEKMVADGAPAADIDRFRLCFNGQQLAPGRLGRDAILSTRPFLEGHVRRLLRAEPNVRIADECDVQGLVASSDRRRIVGVRVAERPGPRAAPAGAEAARVLPADLVVDCTGRRSATPARLEALGYAPPAVDELRIDVAYLSCLYRLPPGLLDDDVFVIVGPTADGPRGGALVRVEGDRWLLTLAGMAGERPPRELAEQLAFADRLPTRELGDVVRQGEPLGASKGFRHVSSVRQRYERLRDLPDGLLVAGDAVCSFNPIYGQGMTVAALEAVALRRLLDDVAVPAPRTWFKAITPIVDAPWDMAIGADLSVRAVDGRRNLQTRALGAYTRRFHAAAAHDPTLTALFMRVTGLLDPPTRLLAPATLARVLQGNLHGARGGAVHDPVRAS